MAQSIDIHSPLLWRLFGPKDRPALHYPPQDGDPEGYTSLCTDGSPGDFIPSLQIECKIGELLPTLIAQRNGIHTLHSHLASLHTTQVSEDGSTVLE